MNTSIVQYSKHSYINQIHTAVCLNFTENSHSLFQALYGKHHITAINKHNIPILGNIPGIKNGGKGGGGGIIKGGNIAAPLGVGAAAVGPLLVGTVSGVAPS